MAKINELILLNKKMDHLPKPPDFLGLTILRKIRCMDYYSYYAMTSHRLDSVFVQTATKSYGSNADVTMEKLFTERWRFFEPKMAKFRRAYNK